jgi:hypothetical protein
MSVVYQTFYGESHHYRASLFDVTVIMALMCVHVVELLCQAVTGQIPSLKFLLPGVRRCLWLCVVLSGIKRPRYLMILALRSSPWY